MSHQLPPYTKKPHPPVHPIISSALIHGKTWARESESTVLSSWVYSKGGCMIPLELFWLGCFRASKMITPFDSCEYDQIIRQHMSQRACTRFKELLSLDLQRHSPVSFCSQYICFISLRDSYITYRLYIQKKPVVLRSTPGYLYRIWNMTICNIEINWTLMIQCTVIAETDSLDISMTGVAKLTFPIIISP